VRRLLFRLLASAHPETDHVSDAELLRRFASSNDSAAFELIVRRHADAVWCAAYRILRTHADAEDAFQAAFLALIRKAKSIRTPSAGGWLHRVAVNAALKAKAGRTRSVSDGVELGSHPIADAPGSQEQADVVAAVHEELARLSERERLPVVLCDLEGMSHADAAKALGWPVGTVSGRLSRARAKLRDRLERRGMTPSAALLPALIAPPHLITNALSLTSGTASPAVAALTEGVLAMNATATWKWVAVTVCAGAMGAGVVFAFGPGGAKLQPNVVPAPAVGAPVAAQNLDPPTKEKPTEEEWNPKRTDGKIVGIGQVATAFPELGLPKVDPNDPDQAKKYAADLAKLCPRVMGTSVVKIEPTDDALRKVLKAQLNCGVMQLERFLGMIRRGAWVPAYYSEMFECLADMQATASELWTSQPKELIPWLEELVLVAKELERVHCLRVLNGSDTPMRFLGATQYRLRAEAALLKAKKRA
jgi:RNA polymerase sigma factor (sigma-70 family)